ncbi:MAG TPA: glycosyltransferase family 2 protein, partial [Actinomycetota bacterium]|nr:glycosyltransferase family 2 protein [Actinomycetota bacterium]
HVRRPLPSDLAVVIVNRDAGAYLERCIRSVFGASAGLELDVLIVDNDSSDGSARFAVGAHPEARLIETGENRGFAAGVNVGIGATDAPFVFVLNPDAEIWEGTLDGFVKVAWDHPRAGAIGPLVRNSDGTVYSTGRVVPSIRTAIGHAFLGPFFPNNRFTRTYRVADWDRGAEREVDWISGSAFLVRREALDGVGLLDEGFFLYAEEVDLFTRLRSAGWTILFTPELEVIHEGGVSTGRSRAMHLQHSRSVARYFAKHHGRGWRRALLPVVRLGLRVRAEVVSLRDGVKDRRR